MLVRRIGQLLVMVAFACCGSQGFAADAAKTVPAAPPLRTTLPQDHEYQKQLRGFMATLKPQDFDHGVTEPIGKFPGSAGHEDMFRNFIFTQMGPPLVGSKRGPPSINAPSKLFLLPEIETPAGVLWPPVYPESLISLVEWDYPGNVYHKNRGLKLRAFVVAAINLMMLDDYLDRTPASCRADFMAHQLIASGAPYLSFKDLLTAEARAAYETGLKKLARRIIGWGPKEEEIHYDLIAAAGLWFASQACQDAAFTKEAEDHARVLLTDPRYFHPAGYFLERGGFDAGFAGTCNWFVSGAALASNWPFARAAIDKAYRLRAHLILPEPNEKWTGPTHFNTRLSSPATIDQWEWGKCRDWCASLISDEAVHLVKLPELQVLEQAAFTRAGEFNRQIAENPVRLGNGSNETPYIYFKNEEIGSNPWSWRLWRNYNFPVSLNFGHDYYPVGAYAHRKELEERKSPLLKSPFLRDGTFVRDFGKAFTVAKMASYAAIVHTGPVGDHARHDTAGQFKGPLGLGGGQLSAFWTPATSSVILGRRAGMTKDKTFDNVEEWRQWPIHAVSGYTTAGRPFTSARIVQPAVTSEVTPDGATVTAAGVIPTDQLGQTKVLTGQLEYLRTFKLEPDRVRITTQIQGDGRDQITELYETLPVFLRDAGLQPEATPTVIEFQLNGAWAPATDKWLEQVTAVKLTRFDGAVQITFDAPRRVKLSPADWTDTWFTKAMCRNVMIDLLEAKDQVQAVQKAAVGYRLHAIQK